MKKMRFATFIFAFSFIVGSIAGPLSTRPETECSTICDGTIKKFDYEIGTTYEYSYEADTVTALRSDGQDASRLRIRATAQVTPITKCDFSLRLSNVRLQHPQRDGSDGLPVAGEDDFRLALERSPLKFAFADGHVQHLCPAETEPIWVVNIKRGVVSMFQNAMPDFEQDITLTETDVTGQCQTHYSVGRAGWLSGEIAVRKTKDLSDCSRRTDHFTSLQFNPYHPQIARKSEALVKSTHQCDQIIKHGHLIESDCAESHAFQPFSNEKTGAVTNGTQKLKFVRSETSKPENENGFIQSRVPLSFDHKYKEFGENAESLQAEQALRELCKASRDDIRPEVPRLFSSLVHRLQELKTAQLYDMYKNVERICRTNTKAKKLFFDAVPLTGSEAGVELMRDLIMRKEITIPEVDTWMLMLGFFPRPTKQMIASLMPLLDPSIARPKTLLGISTLTHSYCKNNLDCQREPEIRNLVKHLSATLGEKCASVGEQQRETIAVTLKALGNIGYIKDALPILQRCYQATENPIEIRLAAIDALRRLPCTIDKDELLSTFLAHEEDSEVRIAAYLAIMKCPTPEIVSSIHSSLETEVVNQVGSFAWTHLTSVQETSDPCKRDIKKILSSKKLQKKFSTDVRKFSRYYEGSLYLDSLKTGSHVDGTVVFSPKSYLPRSSSLGLTLDIFGESINLFEVGGRAEGFEHLVESFFGPKGYFPDDTIQKILESARDKQSFDHTKLNEIARIFNVKRNSEKEPSGSFYMRVFGNDLLYTQFSNFEQLVQRANPIDTMSTLMRLLQNEDAEYTKSFMLLDSSLIVPTGAGLPLNLTLNGTATVNLRAGGKLDLSRMRSNSFHVRAHLQPSASVEIASSMVVDAFVAQSGLKMVATAHTSIQADGELTVKGGELVKARINMPKERLDIFDIDSRVYLVGEGQARAQAIAAPQQNHATVCSGNAVSKYLGVEMCAEMEFPDADKSEQRPAFLFAGPVSARAFLRKTDKTMESYNFEYRWYKRPAISKTGSTQYVRTGLLLLDTPKSTINRQLKAEFNYNEPEKTLTLDFVSPIQQLSINGQLSNEPEIKKMKLTVLSNSQEQISILSELRTDENRIEPRFTLRIGGRPAADFSALAMRQGDDRYSLEMALAHLTRQPITFNGAFGKGDHHGNKRYDVDFTLNSTPLYAFSKWFLQVGNSSLATKGTIEYKVQQDPKQHATFSGKCQHSRHANLNVALDFQNTAMPWANWDAALDVKRSQGGSAEATLLLSHGPTSKNTRFLDVRYEHHLNSRWPKHNLTSSLHVKFPPAGIDVSGKLKSELADDQLDSSITLRYKPDKELSLVGGLQRGATSTEIVRGFVKLSSSDSPRDAMQFSGSLTRPQPRELVANVSYRWSEASEAKALVTLRKTSESTLGHEIEAELSLPGQEPVLLKGDIIVDKSKSSARGEAHLNGAIYSTFAEYHKPSIENVRVVMGTSSPFSAYNAEVEMQNAKNDKYLTTTFHMGPNHMVSTDIRIKRDKNQATASAELTMNSSEQPEEKYDIRVDVHKPLTGSEGVITLHCPSRTVGVKWNFSNKNVVNQSPSLSHLGHYEVWWDANSRVTADLELNTIARHSSRDVTGSITIATPLEYFSELAIKAVHHDDGARWKNNGEVKLNGVSALSATSDGKLQVSAEKRSIQSTINLESTYYAPGMLNIQFDHELNGRTAKNIVNLKWATDRQIKVILQTVDNSGPLSSDINYAGTLNITSPFEYFKDLSLAAKITNKDKTALQIEIDNGNTHIAVELHGGVLVRDTKTDANFGFQLQTPFDNFENISSSLRVTKDTGSLTAAANLVLREDKHIAMEMTAVRNSVVAQRNLVLSLHLLSSFQHLEDILLTLANEQKQNQFRYGLEAKWSPEATLITSLEYEIKLPLATYVKIDIVEPFHIFEHFTTELQYTNDVNQLNLAAIGVLGNDKIKLRSSLSKVDLPDQTDHIYHGLLNLITPFAALKNILVKLEHTCLYTLNKHLTDLDVKINEQHFTATHLIQASSIFNFDHRFQLNLPLESVKMIKISNLQTYDGDNYVHRSEIGWTPEHTYTLIKNTKLQYKPTGYLIESDLQLGASEKLYGPFKILVSQDAPANQERKSHFMIEYWPENRIDLISSVKVNPSNGNGQLVLTTPFSLAKSMIFDFDYDIDVNLKKTSLSFQWQEENKIELVAVVKHDEQQIQTDVSIDTPFQNYEKNNLKFVISGDGQYKTGKVTVDLNGQVFEAILDCKKNGGSNDYTLTLTTPFNGFETTSIASNYVANPTDKSVTITAESNLGKIEINAFHNIRTNSMDSGLTFKSPIKGIEHLTIGSHFDVETDGKEASINIENGQFKGAISAKYGKNAHGGFINVALITPMPNFNSVQFDGKYTILSNQASLQFLVSQNSKKITLNANMERNGPVNKATVALTTPFFGFESLSFVGELNIDAVLKSGVVTVSKNDQKAILSAKITASTPGLALGLEFTSPIENYKSIKMLGHYKLEGNQFHANIVAQKENKAFDINLKSVLHTHLGEISVSVKTPVADYLLSSVSINYDLKYPKKHITFNVKKDEHMATIKSELQFDTNGIDAKIQADTSVPGYETVMISLKSSIDAGKHIYSISSLKGSSKYQLTWELTSTQGHLASNIVLKTPEEDSMLYTQYNFNGANSINFDLKLIKQKTMMELSGRMWRQPNYEKVDASILFNTNYNQMTSMSSSVHFDISGENKELKFQTEFNGQRNEISVTQRQSTNGYDISLTGVSTHPDWRTFSIIGNINTSPKNEDKYINLSIKKNEADIKITGSLLGKNALLLSTSMSGFETLTIEATNDKTATGNKVLLLLTKGQETLFSIESTSERQNVKLVNNLSIVSGLTSFKTITVKSELYSGDILADIVSTVDEQKIQLTLRGQANYIKGDINLEVSSNFILPYIDVEKVSLSIKYDGDVQYFIASGILDQEIYRLNINIKENSSELTFQSPATSEIKIQTEYEQSATVTHFKFLITSKAVTLGSFQVDFEPNSGKIQYYLNSKQYPLVGSAEYTIASNRRSVLISIGKSGSILEINGYNIINRENKLTLETQFTMTSILQGLEYVQFQSLLNSNDGVSSATTFKWAADKEIKLILNYLPISSGLTISMTTPFSSYEKMGLMANHQVSETEYTAGLSLHWDIKKIAMLAVLKPGKMSISLSSPFEGIDDVAAFITYGADPMNAAIHLRLNPTSKIEIEADANLKPQNGKWKFSVNLIKQTGPESYIIRGEYDFQTQSLAHILADGNGERFELLMKCTAGATNNSRQLLVSVLTPMEHFQHLIIKTQYSLTDSNSGADMSIQFNNREFKFTGTKIVNDKEVSLNAEITSPISGLENLNVDANSKSFGNEKSSNLNVRMNGESLASFSGNANVNLPSSFAIDLKLDSSSKQYKNVGFSAKFEQANGNGKVVADANWAENRIQFEAVLSELSLELKLASPFSVMNKVHATGKLTPNYNNFGLHLTLNIDSKNIDFKYLLKNQLPRNFETTIILKSTFTKIPETSASISFKNNDNRVVDGRIFIETPFTTVPKIEFKFDFQNNNFETINVSTNLQWANFVYSLESVLENDKTGNVNSKISINTPHEKFSTIILSGTSIHNGLAKNKITLELSLPTTKHSLGATLTMTPENMAFNMLVQSTCLELTPASFGVSFLRDSEITKLAIDVETKATKRSLSWVVDKTSSTHKGQITYISTMLDTSIENKWSADYLSNVHGSVSKESPIILYLKIHNKPSEGTSAFETMTISLDHSGVRAMNAKVNIKYGQDEHFFVSGYNMQGAIIDGSIELSSPMLPFKYSSIKAKLTSKDALVKFVFDKTTNIFSANHKSKDAGYESTFKIEAPTFGINGFQGTGKLNLNSHNIDGSLNIQAHRVSHSLSVLYKCNSNDITAQMKIKTPLYNINNVALNAHVVAKGLANVDSTFSVTLRRKIHSVVLRYKLDDRTLEADFKLQTPSIDVQDIAIRMKLEREAASNVNGFLAITVGTSQHSGKFNVECGHQETTGTLEINSPLLASDPVTFKSNLIRTEENLAASVIAKLPTGTHSIDCKLRRGSNTEMEIKLDSPSYLSGPHSFVIKFDQQHRENNLELAFVTPNAIHSLKCTVAKNEDGLVLQGTLKTPALNIGSVTASVKIYKLGFNNFKIGLGLQTQKHNHQVEVAVKVDNDKIDFDGTIDTTFFNIGSISSRGTVTVNRYNVNVDMQLTTPSNTHAVKGDFKVEGNSFIGNVRVDTPYWDTIEIQANMEKISTNSVRIFLTAKTSSGNQHQLQAQIKRGDGSINTDLKIDSPWLPSKQFQLSGNMTLQMPFTFAGDFSVHTPSQSMKLSSNYRSKPQSSVAGELTLQTSYESMPLLRMSGRMARPLKSEGYDGEFELHTDNYGDPKLAFYYKYEMDDNRLAGLTVTVQTPLERFEVLSGKYQWKNDDSPKMLIFTLNRNTYGYEATYSKNAGGRNMNLTVFVASKQYKFGVSTQRQANRIQINASMATPIKHLQQINFALMYDQESNQSHNFQVELSGNRFRYGVQSELSYMDKRNFKGTVTFVTLIRGYEKIVTKVQQTYSDTYWRYSLEQFFQDEPLLAFLLENFHQNNEGNGKMQLTTSLDNLKTTDAYFRYEMDERAQVTGQAGIKHNGRNLLDINTTRNKAGERVVEILNPIQPITVKYTYSVAGDKITVAATAEWLKSNGEVDSTVGFVANMVNRDGHRAISIRGKHPTRPITLEFAETIAAHSFVQSASISWVDGDSSTIGYDVRKLRTVTVDGRHEYNVTARLNLPIRSFELSTQSERSDTSARTAALFKWDAARDDSKKIGFAFEHSRVHGNGKINCRAAAIFEHPMLEKDLVLRGEFSSDRQSDIFFLGRVELDYSRNEQQKLSVEAKVTKAQSGGNDDRVSVQLSVAHPISNTDIRLVSDVANDSSELSGGFKLSYLDRHGQQRHLELRSKIVKLQKKIQFMLESNAAKLQLNAQIRALESGYLLSVASQLNNQLPISAQLLLTREVGSMAEFTVKYDQTNKVKVRAGLSDPKTIMLEKFQMIGNRRESEIYFSIHLNDSRELITAFKWQPGTLQQLETDLIAILQRTSAGAATMLNDLSAFAVAELADKRERISSSVRQTLQSTINELGTELTELGKDVTKVEQIMHQMYEMNTFYMRDVINGVASCAPFHRMSYLIQYIADDLMDSLSAVAASLGSSLTRLTELCWDVSSAAALSIRDRIQQLPYAILQFSSEVNAYTSRAINSVIAGGLHLTRELFFYLVPQLRQWQSFAPQWICQISNDVTGKLQEYMEQFFNNHYYQQLKSTLGMYVYRVRDAFNYEYWINLWINYSPIIDRITDYALTYLDHPYLSAFTLATENTYNLGVWAYNFLKIEDRARDALSLLMARAEDILMYVIQETIVPDYELPNMASRIVFDPKRGLLEIVQRLPLAWNSFTEAPQFYDSPEYQQLARVSGKLGQLPYSSVKNLIHAVKSEFSWTNMVPRFRGRALLVGNQHYMTFDGRAYEFSGDCSYLLAHDFMDNNFTAVVMYKIGAVSPAPSFMLILDGQSIVIESDLRVALNGQAVQLPLTVGATRITLTGGHVVTVANDARQVWMSYASRYQVLMLEVGGFYHGKTAGLFGSYDHEPFDDFHTPARHAVDSVEDFAASWAVGAKCQARANHAVKPISEITLNVQKACNELFTGYNTMTPCTRKINPQPYRNMCVNDVTAGSSPCAAASAYVTMCRASGYDVTIPEKCLECSAGSKKVIHGEETTLTEADIPRSVDTILVADNTCANFRRTTLSSVARATERSLLAAKLTNNRYAVLTFAGNDAHAVVADGRTFVDFRSLDDLLNNIRNGTGAGSVGQLIEFAGSMAFRAGVAKTVILVPCSTEQPDVEDQFDRLATLLKDSDVVLHVAVVKANDILGFDSHKAYTTKSVRRGGATSLQGDTTLSQQVKAGDHSLPALALSTDGSVFFVGSTHASTARLATEAAGRRVALTAAPATCQHCECTQDLHGAPLLRCIRCSTEHSAQDNAN